MKNIRTCSICLTRCQPPIPEWLYRTVLHSFHRLQEIDRQISYLQQHLLDTVPVKIIYFVPDEKKDGGSYTAVEGCVRKIDENTKSLRIQGTEIPVERIYGIDFL